MAEVHLGVSVYYITNHKVDREGDKETGSDGSKSQYSCVGQHPMTYAFSSAFQPSILKGSLHFLSLQPELQYPNCTDGVLGAGTTRSKHNRKYGTLASFLIQFHKIVEKTF